MFELARLLILGRIRKLAMHYGWAGYASSVLILVLFAFAVSTVVSAPVKHVTIAQIQSFLIILWLSWTVMGLALGKDLSWAIRLNEIIVFPVSGFLRLYTVTFLLGFLSIPLLGALFVIVFVDCLRSGFVLASLFSTLVGAVLYIASIRLTVSFGRAAIVRGRYLSNSLKAAAALAGTSLLAYTCTAIIRPRLGWLLPGYHLGFVLSGEHRWLPLAYLGAFSGFLAVIDFVMQRSLIYSGIRGPLASEGRMMAGGSLILLHSTWPGPLYRISMLCWLRSRSALLLLMWGTGYSFFFMYFTKPDTALDFFIIVWMQLLFYAYLRGNLLGTDRSGVWLYYRFPVRIEGVIRAKSHSLSLLQSCMIAGGLMGGFLSKGPGIPFSEWMRVLSYAISSVLFGEICGLFISIRYPDPIDRTSQFSGGTSAGAFLIPLLQALYLGVFVLATGFGRRLLPPMAYGSALTAIPAIMFIMQLCVLPWVGSVLLNERETIMKKLSAFPS